VHGHDGPCLRADGTVPTVDVGNKIAQPSASWLSGGVSQRQIVLQAALNFGQPRPLTRLAALVDHIGLAFHTAPCHPAGHECSESPGKGTKSRREAAPVTSRVTA
jgi:hypothetical protein